MEKLVTLGDESLPDTRCPTPLFREGGHAIHWLGVMEESAFRCNSYLISDGDEALLVDPGGRLHFAAVVERVAQILPPERVTGMILCHQDPDVAASMTDWLGLNPRMRVFSTPRTHVLLPYYGDADYPRVDVEHEPRLRLPSGRELRFIPAPFLHFPGAFVTYDEASGYLFSGDIWASLDIDRHLTVRSFAEQIPKMDLFHKDYMASNLAARGFVHSLAGLDIRAILPQHGPLVPETMVGDALAYLEQLHCGTDLIYPDPCFFRKKTGTGPDENPEGTAVAVLANEHPAADPLPVTDHRREKVLRQALAQASRQATLCSRALRDLKEAERHLDESRALLAEAHRVARLAHWEWEISGDRFTWSDQAHQLFGLTKQSLPGGYAQFLAMAHPDDRSAVALRMQGAREAGQPYDFDYRIRLPGGEIRVIHARGEVTRDASGNAVRMFGTVQEITDRKRIEDELRINRLVIEVIDRLRDRFIAHEDPFVMYDALLADLLSLTESRHGLIGEVLTDPDGTLFLRAYALSNLAWNAETSRLYEEYRRKGFEFRKLDNLFGRPITSGVPILANDPANDPRRGGLPDGHPPITAFLGIPVFVGGRLVGEVGLANRTGGYDEGLLARIAPVISACGQIMVARQEREARKRAEERLAQQANLDGLMGIPNRRRFDDYLEQEWRRAARSHMPLSLIMLDIDHFKRYNDHYGHLAGDDCLVRIGQLMAGTMRRPADLVARYGGEELACILPETGNAGAVRVARELRRRLAELAIPHADSPVTERVTVSMGVATLVPTTEGTPQELIALADRRLYRAKAEGRDRILGDPPVSE